MIDIDTNILQSMPDKIPKCTYQRKVNHIWRLFFEELNVTRRYQLFIEMMRNLKFRPIMKIVRLITLVEFINFIFSLARPEVFFPYLFPTNALNRAKL